MVKKKFLYKMLALYIGIVLLYTSITSGFILFKGFEMTSMQNNHGHELYMDQVSNYADSKFSIALEFAYKISTLHTLIDYRYSKTTEYLYITDLYNDLVSYLQGFSQLGFSLGITKLSDDIVVTPLGTYSYKGYLEELGIDPNLFESFITSEKENIGRNTYVLPQSIMNKPSNKIILFHQPGGNSNLSPIYFFIVLNASSLIPENGSDSLGNFYLYSDEMIYSFINNSSLDESALINYFNHLENKQDTDHLKLGSTVNYINKSNIVPNLSYMYTVPIPSLAPIFFNILKTALLPGLVLLLIGVWIAYKAAQSSYKPIKQLIKFVDEQNSFETQESDQEDCSINELDYIKNSIEQIYSINTNLQSKLDHSLIRLQEDFFRKVIYGIANEDFINENISALKLDQFLDGDLKLILLDCEGMESLHKMIPIQNLSIIIYELINAYKELDGTFDFFVLPLDTKKYCVIFTLISEEELVPLVEHLMDKVSTDLSLDITTCISMTYPLLRLTSGLQELLMLNNYKYSNANYKIITSENIKEIREAIYYYPIEVETCLINYITTNEFNKAKDLLNDLLDRNLRDLTISPVNMTNLKYSIITTFKRCLNAEGKTLTQFVKEYPDLMDEFTASPNSQLTEACFKLFETIFNHCNKDKFSLENSTASNIFMYIHENFDKDISLTDIANHFNLSESYISKLLKNSLDINFKTYVNKLKVKKAKELLAQGNYKVNEVASIVGCNNSNTFIRIFKQYEGVSPGEYIKSLSKLNM